MKQAMENLSSERLAGVYVTPIGLRPYMDDGHKGSLTELGTICYASAKKTQCLQTAHKGKFIVVFYER